MWEKCGISSCTNGSLKFCETLINLPINRIQGNVIWWWWRPNTKCCWVARKLSNQFRCWCLVAKGIVKRRTLAWHHYLWDLILEANCSLEVSETVLMEQRNPEETEAVMTSGWLKYMSNSSVSSKSVRMESKPFSKPNNYLVHKWIILTSWFKWKVVKWWHLTCEPSINVNEQQTALWTRCE